MIRILAVLLLLASQAMAQTASPNLSDQQLLASDPTFQSRVGESAVATCVQISAEACTGLSGTLPCSLHNKRANLCVSIVQPAAFGSWKTILADMVATDANVIGDATQAGTVPLTSGNVATQAPKVTDPHISSAISGQFNMLTAP